MERSRAEAEARIKRMLDEAEERSTTMVAEARASADRVRAESDRELAAAAQRRDSINAQLSNVRQMLATLAGTVPGVTLPEPVAARPPPRRPPRRRRTRVLGGPRGAGRRDAETEARRRRAN